MKAMEFRLGNLVEQRLIGGDKKKFVGVDVDVLKNIFQGNIYFDYLPIPLTEEILLRCGFLYHHDTAHPNRVFRKDWPEGVFDLEEIISYWFGDNFYSVEVLYLHQLQNLFFALTGEELEINL